MKIVRENINFERNMDPKIALGIGLPVLVEKWMKKAFEEWSVDYKLNSDGTITLNQELEIMDVDLSPGFPPYIKFKEIKDDINLDYCELKYLSGFPETIEGYFSVESNNLTSLEGCPKVVKSDFFCRGNPGKFTEADVRKICEVHGEVYAIDSHIDESIVGMDFEKTGDPYSDIDIGKKNSIQKWFNQMDMGPEEYKINNDFTIDIFGDLNLIGKDLKQFPGYIKFGTIFGSFYAGGNQWESLDGFPDTIEGDLQINSPSLKVYGLNKFTENEIRKIINIDGNVYIN